MKKKIIILLVLLCIIIALGLGACLSSDSREPLQNLGMYEPYPGYNQMQERFEKQANIAMAHTPRVMTLKKGIQVQRTPSEYDAGVYHTPGNQIAYNTYFLNADNRGCTACHVNLNDLLSGMAYVHPDLRSAYDIDMSVDQCLSCHTYSPGYVTDMYAFGSIIHGLHSASRNYTGDCMSCHDGYVQDGSLRLWDHVKYERLRGIVDVPDAAGEFSFNQDTLTVHGTEFSFDWLYYDNDYIRYAARISNAEEDPRIFDEWKISVSGHVEEPFTMSLVDLIKEAPSITTTMTIHCTLNPLGGSYISNCEVKGVPLKYLLDKAKVKQGATAIYPTSTDGFTIPTYISHLDKFDSYLVYEIGGERLSTVLGYPLQIWIAGAAASSFVKQVTDINVVNNPKEDIYIYKGWEKEEGGYFNKPNVAVLYTQEGQIIEVGKPYTLVGYADAFELAITAVEFSLDRGITWTSYSTNGTTADRWIYWNFTFTPETPGAYVIQTRAVCEDGTVSDRPVTTMVNAK